MGVKYTDTPGPYFVLFLSPGIIYMSQIPKSEIKHYLIFSSCWFLFIFTYFTWVKTPRAKPPCLSVFEIWKIKLENSSSMNWIFRLQKPISKLIFAGYTGSKNPVRNRLKIQFVKLDFSKLIFQKSSTDQQGVYLAAILSSSAIASLIWASLLASASPILASLLTSAVLAIPKAFR